MIEPGSKLAHYEVVAALGKGGMGEVYRARDTKLGREVAVKVLPSEFSQDVERLERLEREARMLAALNHPNIAAIYGLEQADETRFLVLELVEGDTLADRLKRGAIPVEESLQLALQIAEALEAAHAKGIIHRDLKPANIKVTPEGRVKVLDFGLARAFIGDHADINLSNSPTLSMAATQAGLILGTAAYMSPEQASGNVVDQRTDIWAFGVVLFETLTGRQLFTGKTAPHIIGAVLERKPDWSSLPPNLHPLVRRLLERCLEKEAIHRRQSMTDVRFDLQKALEDTGGVWTASERKTPSRLPWVAAGVFFGVIGVFSGWMLGPEPSPPLIEFIDELPEGLQLAGIGRPMNISPDGTSIVYSANGQLWLRDMDDVQVRPVPGTEGGGPEYPIFSPDGMSVVYWASQDGELRKVNVTGGTSSVLSRGLTVVRGIHWFGNSIYLGQANGVVKIPDNGGSAEPVFVPGPDETFSSPRLLPAGRAMLGTWSTDDTEGVQVAAYDFETQSVKTFFEGQSPRYLATGHLVYASAAESALMAVEFDADDLQVTGSPVPIIENLGVARVFGGAWQFDVSDNGTLVYVHQPGTALVTGRDRRATVVWVDRDGNEEPVDIRPDDYTMARISPDGTKVVLVIGSPLPRDGALPPDLWLYDLVAGTLSQRTFNPSQDDGPVWAPDSSGIYFRSNRNGSFGVYFLPVEGGQAQLIFMLEDAPFAMPWSVSSDGQTLAFVNPRSVTDPNIAVISLDGQQTFRELLADEGRSESEPVISASGRWIAYQDASGATSMPQLAVRPFPDFDRTEYPVTAGGHPVFSRNDAELFYFDGEGISVVPLEYDPDFSYGPALRLFTGDYWYGVGGPDGSFGRAWDVDPGGERLLMITDATPRAGDSEASRPTIHVVLNWFQELRERVPLP